MAKIKRYIISCSSEAELNVPRLFVWGGQKHARWCAESKHEAERHICECRKEFKCHFCDAEIHPFILERKTKTNKQKLSIPKKS